MLEHFATFVQDFVARVGYPGLFLLITLESTLVPIPSELVMPFAGVLASHGTFSLPVILIINTTGALLGSGISYWIGAAGGKPLLDGMCLFSGSLAASFGGNQQCLLAFQLGFYLVFQRTFRCRARA